MLKERIHQTRILSQKKLSLKSEREILSQTNKNMKEFVTSTLASKIFKDLKKYLKKII